MQANPFTVTAESIFEQAKYSFLSERYDLGFEILRDCFDENEVPDQVILDFLNAKIGVQIDGDNISFGEEFPVDEEYKEDIDSVLFELRNLYKHSEFGILNVVKFLDIKLDDFHASGQNEALAELKASKGTVRKTNEFLLSKAGIVPWGSFMYVNDDGIYYLDMNSKTVIAEVAQVHTDIEHVVNQYKEHLCY